MYEPHLFFGWFVARLGSEALFDGVIRDQQQLLHLAEVVLRLMSNPHHKCPHFQMSVLFNNTYYNTDMVVNI